MYARHLVNEGKFDVAVEQFLKYGVPFISSNTAIYDVVAKETLRQYNQSAVNKLREMLFKLVRKDTSINNLCQLKPFT
jgi:hypothetical protein